MISLYTLEWWKLIRLTKPNVGKEMEQHELSYSSGWNIKCYNCFGKVLTVSFKVKVTLCICLREIKIYVPKKYRRIFIAASTPNCLSLGEWMNNVWHRTLGSSREKGATDSCTWINLPDETLNERSQTQRNSHHAISFTGSSRTDKTNIRWKKSKELCSGQECGMVAE